MSKILYVFCFILFACNGHSAKTDTTLEEKTPFPSSYKLPQEDIVDSKVKVTYKIINAIEDTFGYNIFIDGKLFIHQPVVPATIGNHGFKSKKDAQIVAELVVSKITLGEMPPDVSLEEIKRLTTNPINDN